MESVSETFVNINHVMWLADQEALIVLFDPENFNISYSNVVCQRLSL